MLTHSETLDLMEQAHQSEQLVKKQMADWLLEAGIHPNLTSAGVTYRRWGLPPFGLHAWFCHQSSKTSGIYISWSSAGAKVYAGNQTGSKKRCRATGPTVVEALKTLMLDPNFPYKFRA